MYISSALRPVSELAGRERVIVAALRCWARAREAGRSPMPRLYRLLTPLGATMLVVAVNGFFMLAEAHQGRPLQVGRGSSASLTRDEVEVLALVAQSHWKLARLGDQKLGDVRGPTLLLAAAQMTHHQVVNEIGPAGEYV